MERCSECGCKLPAPGALPGGDWNDDCVTCVRTSRNQKLTFNNPYEISDWVNNQISHAEAHKIISARLGEACAYVNKYHVGRLGDLVWHIILDDAIKLRKDKERK